MNYLEFKNKEDLTKICQRPVMSVQEIMPGVKNIIDNVRQKGDEALIAYSKMFDGAQLANLKVTKNEMERASRNISCELKTATEGAARNISRFHKSQVPQKISLETAAGVYCEQRAIPIQRVGLYVPGGTAPLFSSVLMLAIPAVLAGCNQIVLVTPPDKNGKIPDTIQFAALTAGLEEIYCVGGAQAIGAMIFGTETISAVDKILGPGNQYVTAAKQLALLNGVAIDMPAGPSEVAVVADSNANEKFVAADLLSQAEHGPDSQVLLICTAENKMRKIMQETENQLNQLPRKEIAKQALEKSYAVKVSSLQQAMEVSNAYAPEHLILSVEKPRELAQLVINAGSVFLGELTPESAGDYASGTNHTLPTNGAARAFSGVNMDAFYKKITFQELSPQGVRSIGKNVVQMAVSEKLEAHANAMRLRINSMNQ